ncbi:hypothetical protein HK413_04050 [Mucilaginibacter sp. S1162]|uniref:HEPN domain-containing protein n=1 Tax=Mucilaginibacter humi TaxID=2732510 RepID=A0ABX1W0Y7_9SPHI|nr:hypothetical protein [Mucilaginibacter humi]NNU33524.1 hypothetical protein [Mucilaginibacter humi]
MNQGDQFLWKCRENYFKGITPANPVFYDTEDYNYLIKIGKMFIENGQPKEFSYFLRESQYFVSLWAAHILLECEVSDKKIKHECIETIMEYANHPINEKIAFEEKHWLDLNKSKIS